MSLTNSQKTQIQQVITNSLRKKFQKYKSEPASKPFLRGILDLENELKVAGEFWDFLGGEGTYIELLDCFEKAGMELRLEIDEYFSKFM
jgi:type II restriction enzyme